MVVLSSGLHASEGACTVWLLFAVVVSKDALDCILEGLRLHIGRT